MISVTSSINVHIRDQNQRQLFFFEPWGVPQGQKIEKPYFNVLTPQKDSMRYTDSCTNEIGNKSRETKNSETATHPFKILKIWHRIRIPRPRFTFVNLYPGMTEPRESRDPGITEPENPAPGNPGLLPGSVHVYSDDFIDFRWFQWFRMISSDFKWFQVISNWFQLLKSVTSPLI